MVTPGLVSCEHFSESFFSLIVIIFIFGHGHTFFLLDRCKEWWNNILNVFFYRASYCFYISLGWNLTNSRLDFLMHYFYVIFHNLLWFLTWVWRFLNEIAVAIGLKESSKLFSTGGFGDTDANQSGKGGFEIDDDDDFLVDKPDLKLQTVDPKKGWNFRGVHKVYQ